jgi:hypothetical protein
MSALGGIGQQVAGDLFELGKGAVKGTVKAVSDITTDSIEQLLGSPNGMSPQDSGKINKQSEIPDQKVMLKKREEKKQFQEVKARLAEYIERKKQQDNQILQEQAQQKQVDERNKYVEKQKKETFLQQLMNKLARGSHGETDRQKE